MNWDRRYLSPQLGRQNFLLPLILNTDFIKWKFKIGYPQDTIWDRLDWEPAVITAKLCLSTNGKYLQVLYTHPKSHEITLETFHFPKTVQVFSNPTPNI